MGLWVSLLSKFYETWCCCLIILLRYFRGLTLLRKRMLLSYDMNQVYMVVYPLKYTKAL